MCRRPRYSAPQPLASVRPQFLILPLLAVAGCAAPVRSPERAVPATPDANPPRLAPGDTDIYLAPLTGRGMELRIGAPRNVTRRPGYDNQPSFAPDGRAILFTRIADDGQADAYRYNIAADRAERLTRTRESEYSPTPLADGGFSAVRVEMDSTQRLWRFDARGTSPRVLFPDVRPVGYHAWADDGQTVALYVLGEPATLHLANARTGEVREVARGIGRSLNRIPGSPAISFIRRDSDSVSAVMELNVTTGATRLLTPTVDGGDFHAWTPDGTLLMASGSTIHAWRAGGNGWRPVANLAPLRVSRLAVDPHGDQLALVAETGTP